MKRIIALLLTALLLFSLAACGKENTIPSTPSTEAETNQPATTAKEKAAESTAAILEGVTADFNEVTVALTQSLEETFTAVGTTYADYLENKGLVDEWVTSVLAESDKLFARTKESSIAYFKQIAADPRHTDSDFCSDALDDYFDTVYEDAMDTYFKSIYEDAMDGLFDQYYDGIVNEAYDTENLEYEDWSDTSSECYQIWSDASSAVYNKWSDESSYIYGVWSAVDSAFCYNDSFDVDAIIAEYEREQAEQEEELANRVEFEALYEIQDDGSATVVGYSGEGNYITIDSEYEGHDVLQIADSAFKDCAMLKDIVMWADVKTIGDYAFSGCTSLTEISIPNETTVIGRHAFEGCSSLSNAIIWGDPDIGEYAFANCAALTDISIGNDTKVVGAHAYEGCTGVTSLIIWGVVVIGDYAFAGCSGIDSVSIPHDTKSVGNHAFDGCTALASVIVWDDDTAIGEKAFANCPNLSDAPAARGTVVKTDSGEEATEAMQSGGSTDGIRPEFKAAMDSYEAFYDEYCDFMKKYQKNPTDMTLITEYSQMLTRLVEMEEEFEAWEDEDLNDEELDYYLEVMTRVSQKLADVS